MLSLHSASYLILNSCIRVLDLGWGGGWFTGKYTILDVELSDTIAKTKKKVQNVVGIPPINSACYFQEISWKTISPSQIITSRRSQQPTRCSICVEELILPTLARIPWTPTAIAPLKGRWKYHGFAICNSVVDLLLILTNITMAAVFFFSILSPMSTSGPVAQEEEIQEE